MAESLAERLARLIGDRPVSAVARQVGISKQQLASILNGDTRNPTTATIEKLASALGVTRDELLHGRKPGEPLIQSTAELHIWLLDKQREEERHIERIIEKAASQRPALRAVAERKEHGRWLPIIRMASDDIQRLVPAGYGPIAAGTPIVLATDDYPADHLYVSDPLYSTPSDEQEPRR